MIAPYFAASGSSLAALAIFWFFSPVCHQDPARSFWIFGAPVAVCARCLGIYLGAAAGAFFRASRRTVLAALAVALVLNLTEWLTELAGLHDVWMTPRFVLGAALGAAMGALVAGSAGVTLRSPRLRDSVVNQSSR
ncbi:MAG: DUF2085 domain-containing protein [Terriglobales bacterium]